MLSAPSSGRQYAESIAAVTLPERVLDVVEAYEAAGGERDRFVWKWIYRLLPSFTLSSVPQRHASEVRTRKTIFTVFITFLDDLAECNEDSRAFEQIYRSIVWADESTAEPCRDADAEAVAFARQLWNEFEGMIAEAPRFEEFEDVFRYDLRQSLNAMDYSRILNDNVSMANLNGAQHYDSHNMVMFPYADLDLMYSPSFESADLGVVREQLWDLQKMARIGNWLTTWEREINEGDYTAGIVVYALQNDLITLEELEAAGGDDASVTDRIRAYRIEERFLSEWERLRRHVENRDLEAESVDLGALVNGMETVMNHHMASEGYK